ncbi:S-layer homology domain-containing protein [Paenibacillus sp. IHBB 10380]|uniref:S-layer homology domain-containing protein n=1 Tax=Paenibacillus sp. IHBB 10380 TaxID=1566358 RepID=UPI000AACA3B6|nr:S-layer homology domain-containing protein [Paenibacillus sp. IHBB 10380]
MNKITRVIWSCCIVFIMVNVLPLSVGAKSSKSFNDISGSYAESAIQAVYSKGLMNGTDATRFQPTKPITRAEWITVLERLLAMKEVKSTIPSFKDVAKSSWYYGWVEAGYLLGLTSGRSSSNFEPNHPVTREEAAVMLMRALKFKATASVSTTTFSDDQDIASWVKHDVQTIHELGLMNGAEGFFLPKHLLTRQETATLLYRMMQQKSWMTSIESALQGSVQLGWQYGQTTEEYKQSILSSNINTLSPRWLYVKKDGSVTNLVDPSLVKWAHKNNKQVWGMVGNHSDAVASHQVLSDSTKRSKVIVELTQIARDNGLDGLNIDFENVSGQDKAYFTIFISTLADKLHKAGVSLSVNVSPDLGTDWTEVFDYAALGKAADYILLMGYDEHWSGAPNPGSVSSLPWITSGLDSLLQQVSSKKVILALPFYSRDWKVSSSGSTIHSTDMTLGEQASRVATYRLKPVWNKTIQQYTASYQQNSVQHRIWLEESRSLTGKYQMGLQRNIAGFAYWWTGAETPDVWSALHNAERFDGYNFARVSN